LSLQELRRVRYALKYWQGDVLLKLEHRLVGHGVATLGQRHEADGDHQITKVEGHAFLAIGEPPDGRQHLVVWVVWVVCRLCVGSVVLLLPLALALRALFACVRTWLSNLERSMRLWAAAPRTMPEFVASSF
jgi:hypothetical protein